MTRNEISGELNLLRVWKRSHVPDISGAIAAIAAKYVLLFSRLPDKELQAIMQSKYLDGKSSAETAKELGYSRDCVLRKTRKALDFLEKMML